MKSSKNSIIERLRKLYSDQKKGESECLEITGRIKTLEDRTKEMEAKLDKVKKKPENYEDQLNVELDIKIARSDISSLSVKLWNLKDISTVQAEQLFNECEKSSSTILNLESTLEGNAQTLFKTFLETERQSTY